MARTIAKDHDEKRAQILKNAASVFAAEGFDRASMSQLAQACGISKANIYHYYNSKDALLFDLLDNYLRDLRDNVCQDDSDMQPDDRLRKTVSVILKAYQGADDLHQVQLTALPTLPASEQELLRGYQRDMVRYLSDIILSIAPDVFGDDTVKLRATTMSVFGMLNWYYMWNSGAGSEAREDYATLVSNLTLSGIRGV